MLYCKVKDCSEEARLLQDDEKDIFSSKYGGSVRQNTNGICESHRKQYVIISKLNDLKKGCSNPFDTHKKTNAVKYIVKEDFSKEYNIVIGVKLCKTCKSRKYYFLQ